MWQLHLLWHVNIFLATSGNCLGSIWKLVMTWTKARGYPVSQCSFHLRCSAADQLFTLQKMFEKSWEHAKDAYRCIVDFEKAYDRIPREKLRGMLRDYSVDGRLLLAVKSLYSCSEVSVGVGGVKSQPFTMGVGLRQVYMLSPLFVIVCTCMNWIIGAGHGSAALPLIFRFLIEHFFVNICQDIILKFIETFSDRYGTEYLKIATQLESIQRCTTEWSTICIVCDLQRRC